MSQRVVLKRGQRAPAKVRRTRASATRTRRRKGSTSRQWAVPVLALGAAAVALFSAWLYQLPQKLWLVAASGVAEAGFEVRDVEVSGLNHMTRLPVYTAALDGASNSMLLVDLDEVRTNLMLLPWVEEASVGRRLPDTLVVDITERTPVAIWQHNGRHALIDAEGRILTRRDLERFADLPLIVEAGANEHAGELVQLLAEYPAVAEHFSSATWRGGRRWDFHLKSGEVIALPEGEARAREALGSFVRMDRESGLTGRGFAKFDFRLEDRMVVRVSGEPGATALPEQGTDI